jgi:hypothetical protein
MWQEMVRIGDDTIVSTHTAIDHNGRGRNVTSKTVPLSPGQRGIADSQVGLWSDDGHGADNATDSNGLSTRASVRDLRKHAVPLSGSFARYSG